MKGLLTRVKSYRLPSCLIYLLDYIGFHSSAFRRVVKLKTINYHLNDGAQFIVRPFTRDRCIIDEIFIHKVYIPDPAFKIRNRDTVVDLGAHIGVFTVFATKQAKNVNVLCYEPMLENFKLIEKNVRLNMLQNRVKTFNFAVGIKKGFASLYIGDSGLASLYSQGERHVSVKTVTLEDIFSINKLDKIDFLKVDVEGAEWDILRPTGRNHLAKIKKIVIECHSSELRQRIAGFLRNEGFLIQTTQGGHHTLSYIYGRRKECQ